MTSTSRTQETQNAQGILRSIDAIYCATNGRNPRFYYSKGVSCEQAPERAISQPLATHSARVRVPKTKLLIQTHTNPDYHVVNSLSRPIPRTRRKNPNLQQQRQRETNISNPARVPATCCRRRTTTLTQNSRKHSMLQNEHKTRRHRPPVCLSVLSASLPVCLI